FHRYPRAASAVGLLMASGCVKGKRHGAPISEPTSSAGKTKAGALNSVAPATLGLIEGHVGPVHHLFEARSLGVSEADSGAGRACQRTKIGLQAHGREIPADRLSQGLCLPFRDSGHDNAELLAAEPGKVFVRAQVSAGDIHECAQRQVPDSMAVSVIHLLEVIEIEHDDGHERPEALFAIAHEQRSAVHCARQGVAQGSGPVAGGIARLAEPQRKRAYDCHASNRYRYVQVFRPIVLHVTKPTLAVDL